MGMEVVESRLSNQSVEAGGEVIISLKENANGGPVKPVKDEKTVSEVKFHKDAVDEWPEPKKIHSFWFVKYRSFEDQKLRAKFEQLDKDVQKKHQSRSHLIDKLREKKGERAKIISELKALVEENKQYWSKIDEKRKEIEPLQQALGQLRGTGYGDRDKRSGLCGSEQELNDVIKSLQYRIQHESIPLSEEKQILREIKQLESTREKVVANAAMREKIHESMGEKAVLQDQVKVIGVGLDDVRKNQKVVKAKINKLDEIKEGIDNDIRSLEEELTEATQKRDKTFESIQELRKQREEGNLPFYENRSLLIKAKELAAKKDVEGLQDLSEREATKFYSLWSSNKAFREDYEKRILSSLDSRQFTRDGRIRNPSEKPILLVEPPSIPDRAEVAAVSAKESVKQPKENYPAQAGEIEKNDKVIKNKKEIVKNSTNVEDSDDYYFVPEKVEKDPPMVNEQKLMVIRREEEIAKAKQALERKKKMAEKAAAKAAIKAQKEAEKKEKECEKRLKKKKAGASVPAAPEPEEEQTEAASEAVSSESQVFETPVPENTDNKNGAKNRKLQRPKGVNSSSLPKTIIKRKKATNHLMYASVGGAIVAILLLAILGYQYLM